MEYRHTIKAFRKEMLISQTELAKRLGVSFATVNRWGSGLHDPTCAARRKLRPLFKKIRNRSGGKINTVTGEVKNRLDRMWDHMWSNQMTSTLIGIRRITCLIFIKPLDDNQIKQERKINGASKE